MPRGLKIMVGLAVVVMCSLHDVVAVGAMPRPCLTVNRTATVAQLICEPPLSQSSQWESVHELRVWKNVRVGRQLNTNITLAFVASTMKDPQREQVLPDISRVVFGGTWQHKSPSLTIVMPFTEKDSGHYFCTGEYSDRNGHLDMFSTQAHLVQDSSSTSQKGSGSFKAKLIDSHEVHVTWHMPSSSKFRGARVSRIMVDANKKALTPQLPLFSTSGSEELLYTNNAEILLSNFRRPSDTGNYSVTVFVKTETCDPSCRYQYSCYVPSGDCTGDNARFCTCGHKDAYLAAKSDSDGNFKTLFHIFCILFSLLLIVVMSMLVFHCLFKADKYDRRAWVKKLLNCSSKNQKSSEQSQDDQLPLRENESHDPKEERKTDKSPPRARHSTQKNQNGEGSSHQTEEVNTDPESRQGDMQAANEQQNDESTNDSLEVPAREPGLGQNKARKRIRAEDKSNDKSVRHETGPDITQNEGQSGTNDEQSEETDPFLAGTIEMPNTSQDIDETRSDNQSLSGASGGTHTHGERARLTSYQVEDDTMDNKAEIALNENEKCLVRFS